MPMDDQQLDDTQLIESLTDLLEREASALRTADFGALGPLAEEKERLATLLAETGVHCPPDMARHLQARAQRNAMLLDAAQAGLREAGERLRELSEPPPPLQTYDGTGRRSSLSPPPATERRA